MKSKAFIFIAFVLVCSAFAEENSRHETKEVAQNGIRGDEPKHINTGVYCCGTGGGGGGGTGGGAGGGGAGGPGGYSGGFSHKGAYGGGQICNWGCCSSSYGYSHVGGGFYSCTCCSTAAEAKAYKERQAKASTKN